MLLAHGHPDAASYPVGMVWDEAQIVVDRLNGMETTRAIMTQMAVASLLSAKGGKEFRKLIKGLNRDE